MRQLKPPIYRNASSNGQFSDGFVRPSTPVNRQHDQEISSDIEKPSRYLSPLLQVLWESRVLRAVPVPSAGSPVLVLAVRTIWCVKASQSSPDNNLLHLPK